ncbi:MAG: hypothetical protein JWP11_888 [Frankiales bacterium]|nr:hypothetical protein [Frankiales bacterium]
MRLAETDEFGLVVRAIRSQGRVSVDVDRVDMLSGDEGEKAAAAAGQDYANDYFLVNNNPRTRRYVLAGAVHIWRVDNAHADTPRAVTVTQWLTYLHTPTERKPLFHFDVENGLVVGIEEQYRP